MTPTTVLPSIKFDEEYVAGVTIVKRKDSMSGPPRPKMANVYIDGILVTMPEDALNRLIEIGFLLVVKRKLGTIS